MSLSSSPRSRAAGLAGGRAKASKASRHTSRKKHLWGQPSGEPRACPPSSWGPQPPNGSAATLCEWEIVFPCRVCRQTGRRFEPFLASLMFAISSGTGPLGRRVFPEIQLRGTSLTTNAELAHAGRSTRCEENELVWVPKCFIICYKKTESVSDLKSVTNCSD